MGDDARHYHEFARRFLAGYAAGLASQLKGRGYQQPKTAGDQSQDNSYGGRTPNPLGGLTADGAVHGLSFLSGLFKVPDIRAQGARTIKPYRPLAQGICRAPYHRHNAFVNDYIVI